jgi:hypothetical protein
MAVYTRAKATSCLVVESLSIVDLLLKPVSTSVLTGESRLTVFSSLGHPPSAFW